MTALLLLGAQRLFGSEELPLKVKLEIGESFGLLAASIRIISQTLIIKFVDLLYI